MADYYSISVRDVTEPEKVGFSMHDVPDGTYRVFVSLEGLPINIDIDPEWKVVNWSALTLPCAEHLCELLLMVFEDRGLPHYKFRYKRSLRWQVKNSIARCMRKVGDLLP
jgi:hypothetical protein